MEQQLPIYFTKRGRGWRNTQRLVTLRYKKDGKKIHTFQLQDCHLKRGSFSIQGQRANGYYIDQDTGELVRITNLTGAKKGELRKRCPKCKRKKPLSQFDKSGRRTDMQRDQSRCCKCR
ncbi:hypothetical protein D1159_09960 [Pseudoflavonifractor sp. 524-17]|uniref:hypothetical protein n=1 Tax=Pseudoflavonifractor sp. 524-17 TaxID=2304577 RepID=UPI00137A1DD4|nr:hypothetical protein [Pseudoflavonifractor sp. 524-17]NCE64903.1 hypothetical protein [Pseudoflavonifractor sp. 524-17]